MSASALLVFPMSLLTGSTVCDSPCLTRCYFSILWLTYKRSVSQNSSADLVNHLERFPPVYNNTAGWVIHNSLPRITRKQGQRKMAFTSFISLSFPHYNEPHNPEVRMTYSALCLEFFLGSYSILPLAVVIGFNYSMSLFQPVILLKQKKMYVCTSWLSLYPQLPTQGSVVFQSG